MPQIDMNPYHGILIKGAEITCFFPLHAIIHYQHINGTNIYRSISNMKKTTGFYRGIQFNLAYLPINKYMDLAVYKHYDSSIKGAILSSSLKAITYPLNTCEIYYLLNNRLPKFNKLYNGFSFYYASNTISYLIWFNSLNYFNRNINIKNYNLKNATVGLVSGLIVDILMNPIRVLKTNYQNSGINTINLNTFKNMRFVDRGMKMKLILSCIQSSFFNVFIMWK